MTMSSAAFVLMALARPPHPLNAVSSIEDSGERPPARPPRPPPRRHARRKMKSDVRAVAPAPPLRCHAGRKKERPARHPPTSGLE